MPRRGCVRRDIGILELAVGLNYRRQLGHRAANELHVIGYKLHRRVDLVGDACG